MGTGGSFLRSQDDDDMLGTDLDGNGVVKRIPIEIKSRPRLGLSGLKSVGSFGKKPKGGSLRSALSVDLENPECERIRKDFELYRLERENEIGNMQKKERKLETENKRQRAELLALQKTCQKLRLERDAALMAEQQALARAAAFESDRDKVQRQFKIFRETKESEIQNLLRAKRELETKLTKLTHGGNLIPDDLTDSSISRSAMLEGSMGSSSAGDWWTVLETEPSLGSMVQLHQPAPPRGPEFAPPALMELEGPFTNVNKDDWSSVLASMTHVVPRESELAVSAVVRVYVCCTRDMQCEAACFIENYEGKIRDTCSAASRGLTIVHLSEETEDSPHLPHSLTEAFQRRVREEQIHISSVFVAFLGEAVDSLVTCEVKAGCMDVPSAKPALVCCLDPSRVHSRELWDLHTYVQDAKNTRVLLGGTAEGSCAEAVATELIRILRVELGVADRDKEHSIEGQGSSKRDSLQQLDSEVEPCEFCGGALWDVLYNCEQTEALQQAALSTCQLGFERYYERLNNHVASAGPQPPLLVMGTAGSGCSLLLAKWIQLQQERSSASLVLFHFVGSPSSVSADPTSMIRRLTAQLLQQMRTPPALTGDPGRLVEEFPRWLEKISARLPGGTILVLDAIDRFTAAEVHLKWLLDPLPVDTRVIVSVREDTCPQAWRSWPTLPLEPLSTKTVKELVAAELAVQGSSLEAEEESQILTHCRTPTTCCPLYVIVLARFIASVKLLRTAGGQGSLEAVLSTGDCTGLYLALLQALVPSSHPLTPQILQFLSASRCGLGEEELLALIPSLTFSALCSCLSLLTSHLLLQLHAGLYTFSHTQAREAVLEFCFGADSSALQQVQLELAEHFSQFLQLGSMTSRAADELPWLLKQLGDRDRLKLCVSNLCVFQQLYAKGRCGELQGFWQWLGADKETMALDYLAATKKLEEAHARHLTAIPLKLSQIADVYETLGRFLKDMGLLNQALPALQRALEMREAALDPDHPAVAQALHHLAGLHAQWGKFATAEALFRQATDIYENALGHEHYLVARELEAMAALYTKQDKHDIADPLKKRAHAIMKRTQGPRHSPGHMQGINPLQKRALQLEELAMGPDSVDRARTLNELGVLYYLQNNFETAESFFKRALEMREGLLGREHPDVAQSLNNLAALYNDRRQHSLALPLYERALAIRRKQSGPCGPGVAGITTHLALIYKRLGKLEQAEPLYRQAVEIREKTFGAHHPSVATALVNLAVLCSQQNKYAEAEPLYERALRIYEESLDPQHPRVAETLRNLAVMKYEMKDYETAARLYKKATEIKEHEAGYAAKLLSRRSSSGDTNSTIKNILHA